MVNLRKKEFYDIISGDSESGERYGTDATISKKVDNVDLVYDSRGRYLGIRTCRGKFENGIYIANKGPYDFKSISDLKVWAGKRCRSMDFLETKDGAVLTINP